MLTIPIQTRVEISRLASAMIHIQKKYNITPGSKSELIRIVITAYAIENNLPEMQDRDAIALLESRGFGVSGRGITKKFAEVVVSGKKDPIVLDVAKLAKEKLEEGKEEE